MTTSTTQLTTVGAVRIWLYAIELAARDVHHEDPHLRASARWFLRDSEVCGLVLSLFGISQSWAWNRAISRRSDIELAIVRFWEKATVEDLGELQRALREG